MNLKHTIAVASILLIAGCSSLKKTEQSTPPVIVATNEGREKIILTPEGAERTKDRDKPIQLKKVETQPKEHKPTIIAPITPRKEIMFPENQTHDVRIRYDALTSDELVVSLDELSREFCYPYKGKVISEYGNRGRSMHTGVDIKAIPRDTIRAALAGVVRMSKPYSGYGNVIVIRHYNGIETVYSHNATNLVGVNDKVEAGTPIALAGRTGRATTEHLHFEVRVNGEHINPRRLLDCENHKLKSGTLRIEKRGERIYATNGTEAIETPQNQTLYADITPPTKIESQQTSVPATKITQPATKVTIHTVVKGDTLSSISRRYGTTVDTICKLNNIKPNGILSLGQKIKVQ